MTALYTIGHSRHEPERFVALLAGHGVQLLVDVRSQPYSRWAPHFQRAALARLVEQHAIDYRFLGQVLGGRPAGDHHYLADGTLDVAARARAPDFRAAVEQLVALARDRSTAVMCAEEDPERCHRHRLVAPAVRAAGLEVLHIRGDGRLQPDLPAPQLELFE